MYDIQQAYIQLQKSPTDMQIEINPIAEKANWYSNKNNLIDNSLDDIYWMSCMLDDTIDIPTKPVWYK